MEYNKQLSKFNETKTNFFNELNETKTWLNEFKTKQWIIKLNEDKTTKNKFNDNFYFLIL